MRLSHPVLAFIFATVLLVACRPASQKKIIATLGEVDSYINERPDSALAVLRSINVADLPNPSQRAYYAILHSMALDKCYIDLQVDSILAPAFWYLKYGNASNKLNVWYYRSVLSRNAGDIDNEMSCLVRAEQYIPRANNPSMAGFVYTAKRVILLHIFDLKNAAIAGRNAVSAFRESGEEDRLYNAWISLANIDNLLGNYTESSTLIDSLRFHRTELTPTQKNKLFGIELKYRTELESGNQDLLQFLEEYLAEVSPSQVEWVLVALAYLRSGDPGLANEMLSNDRPPRTTDEEIAFQNIQYKVFEALGHHEEALEALQVYTVLADKRITEGLSSKARFATIEEQFLREKAQRNRWIVVLLLGCLLAITTLLLGNHYSRKRILHQQQDSEALQDRLTEQSAQVLKLKKENREAWHEVKRLEVLLQQNTLPQSIRHIITERIAMLNEYGVRVLSGKELQASIKLQEKLQLNDKQQFIQRLSNQFCALTPQLATIFEQRRLTEQEKTCCALLSMGLKPDDIALFLNLSVKRCYNVFNSVRLKMGWKGDRRSLQTILADSFHA